MKNFARFVVEHPRITAVILIAITAFWIYAIPKIKIDPDMLNYLPKKDPDVIFFKKVGEKFGSNYISLVGIESDDIFSYETLSTIRKLTEEFEKLSEVYQVTSLSNIIDIKKIEGGIEVSKLLPEGEIPKDPQELKKIRDYALSEEMYRGRLVSRDGKVSLIMVRLREDAPKVETAAKIKEIAQKYASGYKLYFSGFPQVMEFSARLIPQDMKRLLPIVILVTIVSLFLSFGSVRGVALPLSVVLIALVWTLGFMSITGMPLTIISPALPVLLIAVGTAYGIHVLSRYYEWVEPSNYKETFFKALATVGVPVFMAGFTTAIGFISNTTASLTLMKQLGLSLAFGVAAALLISISGVPVALLFLGYKPMPKSFIKKSESGFLERFLDKWGSFVFNHAKPIIVSFVIVAVIVSVFIPRITREVNLVEYFPKDSEPRLAEKLMENYFGGSQFFSINIKAEDVKSPAVMQTMYYLSKRLRAIKNVKNPQSIAGLLAEMNYKMNDTKSIPAKSGEISNLWLFIEGEKLLEQMVDSQYKDTIVQATIDVTSSTIVSNRVIEIDKLLKSMPTELVAVNIGDLDPLKKEKVANLHARKIAEMVLSDVKFHKNVERDLGKLSAMVKGAILAPTKLTLKEKIKLMAVLEKFTSSENFEIPLPKEKAKLFAEKLVQNAPEEIDKIQIDYIASTLKSILDESKIGYEEDQINLASDFIQHEVLLFAKEKRAKTLLKRMDREIRVKMDNPDLKRDVYGDFWHVNDEIVYIPIDEYQKIFGKLPEKESITKFELALTGMPPLLKKFNDELLKCQLQSLFLAIGIVLILMMLLLRSLTGGLLSITPVAFTALFNFGLMGIGSKKLPLDNSAAMIASIAIGVGIDYSIHFISRLKLEIDSGKSMFDALETTMEKTGRAILVNTIAVAAGFLVLIFSEVEPLRRFGILLSVAMFVSATSALTLFPALIITIKPKFLGRKLNKTKEVLQ